MMRKKPYEGFICKGFTKDIVLYSTDILAPILLWSYISQPLRKILEHPQVFHIFLGNQLDETTSYNYLETEYFSYRQHFISFVLMVISPLH